MKHDSATTERTIVLLRIKDRVAFVKINGRMIKASYLASYLEMKHGKIYKSCLECDHYEVEEEIKVTYSLDWEMLKRILLTAKESVIEDIYNRFDPKYNIQNYNTL